MDDDPLADTETAAPSKNPFSWTRKWRRCAKCYREWRFVSTEVFGPAPKTTLVHNCCYSVLRCVCTVLGTVGLALLGALLIAILLVGLVHAAVVQNMLYAGIKSQCRSHADPIGCAVNASWAMYAPVDCHALINETHYAPANRTYDDARIRSARHCYDKALYEPAKVLLSIEALVVSVIVLVTLTVHGQMPVMRAWWQRIEAHRARWRSLDD